MQLILTQLIKVIVICSITLFIGQFVHSISHSQAQVTVVESSVKEITVVENSVPSYATLNWVLKVEEPEVESVDVVAIARSRMPSLHIETVTVPNIALLGIRELKKLASERKLKGYGNMRKAELIAALI